MRRLLKKRPRPRRREAADLPPSPAAATDAPSLTDDVDVLVDLIDELIDVHPEERRRT